MNFSDPHSNVLQMGLRDGMKVGDLGTGTGYYALAAAAIVGTTGKVYAIDIHEDILAHVKDKAEEARRRNIETVWGNIEKLHGTKLREDTLDAVILSNVLFQLEEKEQAIKEVLRITKPGGKLLIIDWAGSYGGMGPATQHVVTENHAEELFIGHGFHKQKDFRAGPHHYAILFTTPDASFIS